MLWLAVSESLPVLCSAYHMPRSWSEVSKEMLCSRAEWSQPWCT